MADTNSIAVPMERFNDAHLRLDVAKSLLASLEILIDDCGPEMPITTSLLSSSMHGIGILLEDATNALLAKG